jgi:peptide/nickel transport system permease protein
MKPPPPGAARRRFLRLLFARLRRNRVALAGLLLVCCLAAAALLAPWVAPHDPTAIDEREILTGPSRAHLLGTDDLGRDVLSRMIYGARISLAVGFVSVGIAVLIGTSLGACAGFFGGLVDGVIMRFVDIMLCFPSTFLILAVIAFVGPSIWNVMLVIGVTGWMGVCRLVRAEFLTLRERDFVVAARAIGAGDGRLIFRHILPNALPPVLVAAVLGVAGAILTESGLSFLGLGVQPPVPSWGNILTAGKDNIDVAWWLSFFPGIAITVTMLGYNMLGEGLRDALDPRISGSE